MINKAQQYVQDIEKEDKEEEYEDQKSKAKGKGRKSGKEKGVFTEFQCMNGLDCNEDILLSAVHKWT